ncbi:MAG: hypothetical protein KatS3mg113_0043 [Planctomycetaceae bacterium]|nr:MAG: hypothetical protein KatS3mg113_0043 [Planctomycetaceae bacterium]
MVARIMRVIALQRSPKLRRPAGEGVLPTRDYRSICAENSTFLGCCLLFMGLLSAISSHAWGSSPLVLTEFIYEQAPVPSCHASTIAETPQGLIAAWFGGSDEGEPDVGIWISRRGPSGWSPPVEVADGVQYQRTDGPLHRWPCWNPVLYQLPQGKLLLFYKCGPSPSTWWGMLTTSHDHGVTWDLPQRLPDGIWGPVKNKPVWLGEDGLLCGCSTEDRGWRVHFEWLTWDEQQRPRWKRTDALNDGQQLAAIQPSVLFHRDGRWQAVGRTRQGKVFSLWSSDQGITWSPMELLELPNPNAGTDALTMRDGRHMLVYNHTTRGRTPLNVAVSEDGKRWQAALVLEHQPGEYSYPAVIQTQDGLIHITYTWKRQRIKHVVLDPARLTLKPIVEGKWPE